MQLHVEGPQADVPMLLRNRTLERLALQDNPGWAMTVIRKAISDLFMELLQEVIKGGKICFRKRCCSLESK